MLQPRDDGQIVGEAAVLTPLMGPRLQGELHPEGYADLALWGAGDLGRLRFTPLQGPFVYPPNAVTGRNGAVRLAQEAPVMVIRGVSYRSFTPAKRCATWDYRDHPKIVVHRDPHGRRIELPWAVVLIEQRGEDLIMSAGADIDEARRALAFDVATICDEAEAYAARCDLMPEADPLLRSLVLHGAHAAFSSIRRDERGRFDGLAAGLAYSAPARTYYRDGYWTLQLLLETAPAVVHEQIELLAAGVQPDGEAPSGVIVSGPEMASVWEELRTTVFGLDFIHQRRSDWWSDHFDSPLFFILTIGDYVRVTGDREPLERHWPLMRAIFRRYCGLAEHGLPVKPRHDRDWADNVYRGGHVAYDLGLWVGALEVMARLGAGLDAECAQHAHHEARAARAAIEERLWRPQGWFADYASEDRNEDHLSLDSITLLRFGAVSDERAAQVLERMRVKLESRHNGDQGFGDWGVMCAFPPYSRREDLRGKTVFPFRYHNGADWPWLTGAYAEERLRRGLDGWRYPMTRWWRTCLGQGWIGAVEYFSPPWGRGSLLQGWSAMPAVAALRHRQTVLAGDPEGTSPC
jgi:hypothetical protein